MHTEHTGDALKAMLADIDALTREGLTDEEVEKTRLIARGELVESFEGASAAARRLARNAGGRAAARSRGDGEPRAGRRHEGRPQEARGPPCRREGRDHRDRRTAREDSSPQLKAIGITALTSSGPEGE